MPKAPGFIELGRRFREVTDKDLESPELLVHFNSYGHPFSLGWPELLQHPRVLLLAEGGSGKTFEMKAQAKRLMREGRPAFFVPIEDLDSARLDRILSPNECREFAQWKDADAGTIGWFFLDSVDELKLAGGRVERAFSRLAHELEGQLYRAHIVMSCRPSDWRPVKDLQHLEEYLPISPPQPAASLDPEAVFLAPLLKHYRLLEDPTKQPSAENDSPSLFCAILLPLSAAQVEVFARAHLVDDATSFLNEIRTEGSWQSARRPLDLHRLISSWKQRGRLGTLTEQREADIGARLTDDRDRRDRGYLTDEQARNGSQRLALALALTRTRTLRAPEHPLAAEDLTETINPETVLPDWSPVQRDALMRRPIFEPAAYGRMRFYHRSIQEFLAACHLRHLLDLGLPQKVLNGLLFAERYGHEVVIPSRREIAAWLAARNPHVCSELINRAPDLLLQEGDLEAVPESTRTRILLAFASRYGKGGRRGLYVPSDAVRRFAHSDLSPIVRQLWSAPDTSSDLAELLLDIISQGRLSDCSDIAHAVALDPTRDETQRDLAIGALVNCDQWDQLRQIADSMLDKTVTWPSRCVASLACSLFPARLTASKLRTLIEQTPESSFSSGGFRWKLRLLVSDIDPISSSASELRGLLSDLIWQGREEERPYQFKSSFGYLTFSLADLCARQVSEARPGPADPELLSACVTAHRFGHDAGSTDSSMVKLREGFTARKDLREQLLWAEFEFTRRALPSGKPETDLVRSLSNSLLGSLNGEDWPWLLAMVRVQQDSGRERAALRALLITWRTRGRGDRDLAELREALYGQAELTAILEAVVSEPDEDPEIARWNRENQRRLDGEKRKAKKHLREWRRWREKLMAESDWAFAPDRALHTVGCLYKWLELGASTRETQWTAWDAEALRVAFGSDVTGRLARELRSLWRREEAIPRMQRAPDARDSMKAVWVYGLNGIAAEAQTRGWAARLTEEEARRASIYATLEMNSFPTWLGDIAEAHPGAVASVIGDEVAAELIAVSTHPRVLQFVANAPNAVRRVCRPRFLVLLRELEFPSASDGEQNQTNRDASYALGKLLSAVLDGSDDTERKAAGEICEERFRRAPNSSLAPTWLKGLLCSNPSAGAATLEQALAHVEEAVQRDLALQLFGSVAGGFGLGIEFSDNVTRAKVLGALARCAYRYIRSEDDQHHEGVFTPDTRDSAEMARGFLLKALLETPGEAAQRELAALADEPSFRDFPDWLRFSALQRAAEDSEPPAWLPDEVRALELSLGAPTLDRDSLFQVMLDRLEDIADDLEHGDFSIRRTLATIEEEAEIQRDLAGRLKETARGAYLVTRESEVADRKKPDIVLSATRGGHRAAVEVKIADKWSLAELERGLHDQLAGQYLRDPASRAGCLVLTFHGVKSRWRNGLTPHQLTEHLRQQAEEIVRQRGDIRLGVFALYLSQPEDQSPRQGG